MFPMHSFICLSHHNKLSPATNWFFFFYWRCPFTLTIRIADVGYASDMFPALPISNPVAPWYLLIMLTKLCQIKQMLRLVTKNIDVTVTYIRWIIASVMQAQKQIRKKCKTPTISLPQIKADSVGSTGNTTVMLWFQQTPPFIDSYLL